MTGAAGTRNDYREAPQDSTEMVHLPFGALGHDEVEAHIVAKGQSQDRPLEILEAGCGRTWPFTLDGIQRRITGIDLDEEALSARKTERRDLDIAIVGDVCNVSLDKKFDIIYSSYVLEHVENVKMILHRFVEWLDDDGLLVIQIPDRDSIYGWLTRLTPFKLHVLYKKYVAGVKNAGQPGFAPYPTVYEKDMALDAILAFAKENNLRIERVYVTQPAIARNNLLNRTIYAVFRVVHAVSGGRLRGDRVNLAILLTKRRRCC